MRSRLMQPLQVGKAIMPVWILRQLEGAHITWFQDMAERSRVVREMRPGAPIQWFLEGYHALRPRIIASLRGIEQKHTIQGHLYGQIPAALISILQLRTSFPPGVWVVLALYRQSMEAVFRLPECNWLPVAARGPR